ncbi:TIGR00180 family glycosyltransferase [Candidatus Daviesbacteria bacterium]|nr:TIGR00180 family glycosyltransferase [Candidatus Daviesbacteria bacterium]
MSSIDLVIPTHNRPHLLKRILDYYQPVAKLFDNIIIADSSEISNKRLNKRIISLYPNNIMYLDKFPKNLEQHYKFAEMVKYIKSKYCVFCPDDDFVIPNAIKQCVNFLEKNPQYSAAHGTYISFYISKNLFEFKKFQWRFLFSPTSISSDNPIDRVASHLRYYVLVLWAVRRSEVVKTCYREFAKTKIGPFMLPVFGELLPDALTVLFGKIKNLNILYGARQYLSQIRGYYPSLIDTKKMGKYDLEYTKFKSCILNNLNKKANLFNQKPDKILDSAMDNYINYSYQEHIMNKIYLALAKYPKFVSKRLISLHTYYLFSKAKRNLIGSIDNPRSKYFSDFSRIRNSVLETNDFS